MLDTCAAYTHEMMISAFTIRGSRMAQVMPSKHQSVTWHHAVHP